MSGRPKKHSWEIALAAALVSASAMVYGIHYLIMHDAKKIIDYILLDLAFVPIEVLVVTMILHKLLEHREKKHLMSKMNMVISTFFIETGTELMRLLAAFDTDPGGTRENFLVKQGWEKSDFASARKAIRSHTFTMDSSLGDLFALRDLTVSHRASVLRLLENPTLLEHEHFTDALWAISHMTDELRMRGDLSALPRADHLHLTGDLQRAYSALTGEWLDYLSHLKSDYPYLFSLAVRSNPFDSTASVVIAE